MMSFMLILLINNFAIPHDESWDIKNIEYAEILFLTTFNNGYPSINIE